MAEKEVEANISNRGEYSRSLSMGCLEKIKKNRNFGTKTIQGSNPVFLIQMFSIRTKIDEQKFFNTLYDFHF